MERACVTDPLLTNDNPAGPVEQDVSTTVKALEPAREIQRNEDTDHDWQCLSYNDRFSPEVCVPEKNLDQLTAWIVSGVGRSSETTASVLSWAVIF